MFRVPSTLNNLLGSVSTLIGRCKYFAYWRLMKFSVAPESKRAIVSALFDFECIKTCSVIDFLADRNTSWSRYCLSSADLIRHRENPGFPLRTSGSIRLFGHLGESQTQLERY